MRVTEAQVQVLALDGGLETDALDFEFLDETFAHALDHVVEDRAAQAMEGLASASSPSRDTTTFAPSTFALVRRGSSKSSLPFGPFDQTFWPLTSTFTFGGITTGCFPILDIKIYQT